VIDTPSSPAMRFMVVVGGIRCDPLRRSFSVKVN
jgi:hypothetical protein